MKTNLVIQTAFVGDLMLTIPLLKQLKVLFPEHETVLLCRQGLAEIMSPLVDTVYEVRKKDQFDYRRVLKILKQKKFDFIFCPHQSWRSAAIVSQLSAQRDKVGFWKWWNFWAFSKRVSKPEYLPDALRQMSLLTAVDRELAQQFESVLQKEELFNPNERAQWVNFASYKIPDWASMRVDERLYEDCTDVRVNEKLHGELDGTRGNGQLHGKSEGIQGIGTLYGKSEGVRKDEWLHKGGKKLNEYPTVFLAPGSVWATKRWTEQGYVDLGIRFLKDKMNVILVGSSAEKELAERISGQMQNWLNAKRQNQAEEGQRQDQSQQQEKETGRQVQITGPKGAQRRGGEAWMQSQDCEFLGVPRVINLAGETTLPEMLKLFAQGRLLISNDSGAMHIAAMVNLPTVAIFGPTTLDIGYRPWQESAIVVQKDHSCRPCGKHGGQKCPIGTHICMKSIAAEEVYQAAQELLR